MKRSKNVAVLAGMPYPLGATVLPDGINFSLFSANATSVELLLFDRYDQATPSRVIPLNADRHRTYYYWHTFLPGLRDGQIYGYRVDGPYEPEEGHRFNASKVLLDPYASMVAYGDNWSRAKATGAGDNTRSALKAVAVDLDGYDWEGDRPLQRPLKETVIYETHVRGLTADPSSGVTNPGTYAGVVEKIPYLRDLGVTAIELLPVQQFDAQEVGRRNPLTGEPLINYWGYSQVALFAPHLSYASAQTARQTVDEFRNMVKALHRAGIEVILDVVFNHTAEGDHRGPVIFFRGLENIAYYILEQDRSRYANYSGTGNTVNCNHSIVRRLIMDCLRHWAQTYHVDGFRFDLASVLSRNERGEPIADAPILWEIESDPVLAGTKLIAEAWDAAGLYQLGSFTGDRWTEWNGRFRDDVRRFVRGDSDTVRDFAWRMTGSFDMFRQKPSYTSSRSINYITSHDGFTLADLVSYSRKHNEANGEGNRDGSDLNYSWNGGVEGPTDNESIQTLRVRHMKTLMTLLMVARGTPMLLGGDEMGRTQHGNNNAYCQDNEVSWYDWRLAEEHDDLVRFTKGLVALRRAHPTLTVAHRLGNRHYEELLLDGISFHGVRQGQPDWSPSSHSLAIRFQGQEGDADFFLIANAYSQGLDFELPPDSAWKRLVDTVLPPGEDSMDEASAPIVTTPSYGASPHTVVLLMATTKE